MGCYLTRRRTFTIGSVDSSTRTSLNASDSDERVFIAATYADLPEADADFQSLRQLYADLGGPRSFDAVTIGRKASGEVRFHREPNRQEDSAEGGKRAPMLACGLGAAVFPSVAADIPVGRLSERRILGTVAGVVGIALGRSDLAHLGEHLDSSPAGLIVATGVELRDSVLAALTNARSVLARSAAINTEVIEQMNEHVLGTAAKE